MSADLSTVRSYAEVRLFGTLRVRRADGSVVAPREWRTAKTADLLRILALEVGRPVPVGTILERLWPDVDESRGRASLRTAAAQLRKAIGEDCVARENGGLTLRDAWVDVHAFEQRCAETVRSAREGHHARAVLAAHEARALYVGDVTAHDTSALWATEVRERLSAMYLSMLHTAADSAVAVGWHRDAIDFATRALRRDTCSERAFRVLMRSHFGLGQTEEALRAFARCREVLADELGADPSPMTRALHIELLSSAPVDTEVDVCLGRDLEVGWLCEAFTEVARTRRPLLVVVTGEEGAGRHRVVHEACRLREAELVGARPEEAAAMLQAVRPDQRLTAVLVSAPADADVSAWLLDLGARMGTAPSSPLVMVTVVPPRHGLAVEQALASAETLTSQRVRVLEVPALAREAVAALATARLSGQVSPGLVATLLEQGGGLAARTLALLTEWSHDGRLAATAEGIVLCDAVDPTVAQTSDEVGRAFELLTEAELEVLGVVALVERPATPTLLGKVLGDLSAAGGAVDATLLCRHAADRLVDLGLVTPTQGAVTIRDAVSRAAVVAWLRPATRRDLHRRIAERAPLPAAERVTHWSEAGEPQLACAAALEAAEQATAEGRYDEARTQLLRVTTMLDEDALPSDRVEVFSMLGDACAAAGRRHEALAAYDVARRTSRAHGLATEQDLEVKAERLRTPVGLLRRASDRRGARPARGESSTRLLEQLGMQRPVTTPLTAVAGVQEVLARSPYAGSADEAAAARVLTAELSLLPTRRIQEARQVAREVVESCSDAVLVARAAVVHHLPDILLGSSAMALPALEHAAGLAADRAAEGRGSDAVRVELDLLRLLVAHDTGCTELATLANLVRKDVAAASATPLGIWALGRVLVERGDVEGAAAVMAAARSVDPLTVDGQMTRLVRAQVAEAQGRPDEAAEELVALVDAGAEHCLLLLPEVTSRLVVLESQVDPAMAQQRFDLVDWATGPESELVRETVWRLLARAAVRAGGGHHDTAATAAALAAGVAERARLLPLAVTCHTVRAEHLQACDSTVGARLARADAARCSREAGMDRPLPTLWGVPVQARSERTEDIGRGGRGSRLGTGAGTRTLG